MSTMPQAQDNSTTLNLDAAFFAKGLACAVAALIVILALINTLVPSPGANTGSTTCNPAVQSARNDMFQYGTDLLGIHNGTAGSCQ